MSLSEIIAKLEDNESVKFESYSTKIRVVIKKGDHPKNNKTYELFVDKGDIANPSRSVDVIAFEVDRTLHLIRTRN